jgi:TatD DNase family protein
MLGISARRREVTAAHGTVHLGYRSGDGTEAMGDLNNADAVVGGAVTLVDTHCHLDARRRATDPVAAVLARAADAGVTRVVTVGTDLAASRSAVALAEAHPALFAAVGVDPNDLDGFDDTTLAELADLAGSAKVVAIGEIGLDYYWDRAPRDVQRHAFRAQLDLARALSLPVVIHDRGAHEDTLATLLAWAADGRTPSHPLGVMHCFSADLAMAEELVDAGFLVSLAGNVTYPKATNLHAVARGIAADALVLETDAPYLAPGPRRGRPSEPAHVRLTAEHVAGLRGEPLAAVGAATTANAGRLFRWDGGPT